MNGPVAVAVGALIGLIVIGAIAVTVEAIRRPRWHDDTDETDTLPRMGRALR